MKKSLSLVIALAAFAASTLLASPMPALPKADSSWKQVSDSNRVLVHSKEIPNSAIVAFRGETTIDAPIAKVANVLIDSTRKTEWVHKIVTAKDLRILSPYERIEYNHTSSGFFLVKDRDFVFHAKASLDKAKQQVVFTLHSVTDELMPEKSMVRGSIDDSRYILTRVGPNQTHLVVEIHADPKGGVPKWLVNLFQKSWPEKTLNGIRTQCAKADVLENPGIHAFFEGSGAAASPGALQ